MDVMELFLFILALAAVVVFLVAFAIGLIYMQCPPKPDLSRSGQEKVFHDPKEGKSVSFPSLTDPASVDLSVIGVT